MSIEKRRRRIPGPALALCLAASLAGCGWSLDRMRLDVSDSDRCTGFMQQAFPDSDIEVTRAVSERDPNSTTLTGAIATVEGFRKTIAAGAPGRDIAVECRFANGILTGFRWTKGPL